MIFAVKYMLLPSSASVNFNFMLEAEIALVSIDPATLHPPPKHQQYQHFGSDPPSKRPDVILEYSISVNHSVKFHFIEQLPPVGLAEYVAQ